CCRRTGDRRAGLARAAGRAGCCYCAGFRAHHFPGSGNLLESMKAALIAGATLGQICGVLRQEYGEHRAS
ncbi:MAG TPA: hypothetical protein PK819_08575, partial [Thermomicrobiales bacterium]|nr:hypothetical protein [Thermomicrobiales bacterium]